MRSNYKRIGQFVRQVNNRNTGLSVVDLKGISINKQFMPSVANINGTDLSTYKLVGKNQFAYNPMHVGRDEVLPISLLEADESVIVSPAYVVFEIVEPELLLPEYLMMWFRRPEFDRNAWFTTDSSVRGGFNWDDFCDITLPVPHPDKQREIVREYNTIVERIKLKEQLIQKLEETAEALYRHLFSEEQQVKKLQELCALITDGKHGDCKNQDNSGYYFLSVKDICDGDVIYENARQIIKSDFDETHRRTKFSAGDILLSNSGTIGRIAILKNTPETTKSTCQKSVAILKPLENVSSSCFMYCLLKYNLSKLIELAGGTSQSNLLLGDLKRFEVPYPSYQSVTYFEELASPVFALVHSNQQQNKILRKLKNIILSRISVQFVATAT
ncbi:restriction endonuclease subunit S [Nitrosomonas sp. Nm33]|uniref:restriction endonuclease subunit S n=1 Tax=Nitrosomonas sp. Nm33 TaxID=133724 RepID=UPI0008954913|nr:restriction endonuclease subunit S [Nitrosomonas sp. Nm33]SDY36313.1 type I restriction enzyme, S subunit [Nitrosomonas sp. Nm33]